MTFSETNEWDLLANRFDTHKDHSNIHPDAAVNIYVGWPVFFSQIDKYSLEKGNSTLNILDFGCGAGNFCKELSKKGHNVTGYDQSEKLLDIAKRNNGNGVEFINNKQYRERIENGELSEKFDIITSIHVFDWVENLADTLKELSDMLVEGGIILLAVFPTRHIIDSIKIQDLFEEIDSMENPSTCIANFDGVKVRVYIRDTVYFDDVFSQINHEKILEAMPEYTEEFFEKFVWTGSKEPEMLILGYKKL